MRLGKARPVVMDPQEGHALMSSLPPHAVMISEGRITTPALPSVEADVIHHKRYTSQLISTSIFKL